MLNIGALDVSYEQINDLAQSSKCLRERSIISVPAGTTHVYRNAVPVQNYLRERRSRRSRTTTPLNKYLIALAP